MDEVCTGGFELRVPFSATRLRELAKIDGAIVLMDAADCIVRAAVHLVPDPTVPTDEPAPGTGPRNGWQADRLPGHLGQQVHADHRPVPGRGPVRAGGSAAILSRANQALATLERYKLRLDGRSRAR